MPAPNGRSRESTIRLDAQGRFWHDARLVEHAGLKAALHSWIRRHPDDRRYILTNGYDWTYFTVDDAPYFVRAIRIEAQRIILLLSDGTEEAWDPETTRFGPDGALYAAVKRAGRSDRHDCVEEYEGAYQAKFTRHAQSSLEPVLVEAEPPAVRIGGQVHAVGAEKARFG